MESQNNESKQAVLKKMTDEALASLCEALEQGKSEELVRYLNVMSRFPRYSFRNVMLIQIQKPEATRVMGYKGWKQIGRQVRKDEKAIRIWAPMKVRENDTNRFARESAATIESESREMLLFRPVCVFDVSQTEGEPLPELSEVSGDPGAFLEKLKGFAEDKGIRLSYESDMRADGVSRCGEIVLRMDLEPAVSFHVLAHEVAHELIHSRESRKELSKQQAETEAEAVAYVVSKTIGLQTGNSSSDYIQFWKGNKETLSESLMTIQRTAAQIAEALLN